MILDKKVAVVMIVKDEEAIIERCLKSVFPIADMFIISDTGSTDNTSLVLMNLFNKPEWSEKVIHHFYSDAWVSFAHNRNEALNHFKALSDSLDMSEWLVLSMDADDQLIFTAGEHYHENMPEIMAKTVAVNPYNANAISVQYSLKTLAYTRPSLIGDPMNWGWEGAVHEYLAYKGDKKNLVFGNLSGAYVLASSSEGARSKDGDKYLHDAELLEQELEKDPTNTRNQFYLARSYHDHFRMLHANGDKGSLEFFAKAAAAYRRRAKRMVGQADVFEEERWYAAYQAAVMGRHLNDLIEVVSERPWRAEAALECSALAESLGQVGTAFTYALLATEATEYRNKDILFVDSSAYGLKAQDRLGTIAYYAGFYHVGYKACCTCLAAYPDLLSTEDVARIENNKAFYTAKLGEAPV